MTKLFKLLADLADIYSSFNIMYPCPVPLHHSGRSNVRCAVHTTTAYNVYSSIF